MEVQPEILEKLKCYFCYEYLSCSPVLLSSTGKNICGRCRAPKKSEETFAPNKVYEDLASTFLFPCKNNKDGCSAKLNMKTAKQHEEECDYNNFACPTAAFDNKCSWTGGMSNIETHYKERHPTKIVDHPYRIKPNIKINNTSNLLIQLYGFVFLLQVKCVVPTGKFWHSVAFLGPPHLSKVFKYVVELSNGDVSVTKRKDVHSHRKFIMHEEFSVMHKINNLFADLGNYDNINFELRIEMADLQCCKCKNTLNYAPIFHSGEDGIFFCKPCHEVSNQEKSEIQFLIKNNKHTNKISLEKKILELLKSNEVTCYECGNQMKCIPVLQTVNEGFLCCDCIKPQRQIVEFLTPHHCKNGKNGCQYKNTNKLHRRKHEQWLCRYKEKCLCRLPTRPIDHWILEHCKRELIPKISGEYVIIEMQHLPRGGSDFSFRAHDRTFYFWFYYLHESINMYLTTDSDELGYEKFICTFDITFIDEQTRFRGSLLPNNSNEYDWFSGVSDMKLLPSGCCFKLTIMKI